MVTIGQMRERDMVAMDRSATRNRRNSHDSTRSSNEDGIRKWSTLEEEKTGALRAVDLLIVK